MANRFHFEAYFETVGTTDRKEMCIKMLESPIFDSKSWIETFPEDWELVKTESAPYDTPAHSIQHWIEFPTVMFLKILGYCNTWVLRDFDYTDKSIENVRRYHKSYFKDREVIVLKMLYGNLFPERDIKIVL